MQWTGLGKVTVATAGTPVPLASDHKKVHSVIVTYDPADSGSVYIKDKGGNIMAALGSNTAAPVILESLSGNEIDLFQLQVDVTVNGKGPYVTYSMT